MTASQVWSSVKRAPTINCHQVATNDQHCHRPITLSMCYRRPISTNDQLPWNEHRPINDSLQVWSPSNDQTNDQSVTKMSTDQPMTASQVGVIVVTRTRTYNCYNQMSTDQSMSASRCDRCQTDKNTTTRKRQTSRGRGKHPIPGQPEKKQMFAHHPPKLW